MVCGVEGVPHTLVALLCLHGRHTRGFLAGCMNVPRTMTTSCFPEAGSLEYDLPMHDFTFWGTIPFTMAKSPCTMLGVEIYGTVLHSFMA